MEIVITSNNTTLLRFLLLKCQINYLPIYPYNFVFLIRKLIFRDTMIDPTTIQTKSLMDLLKAMNEAIITNITITNRHLPKRPILRPLPETETVIDFLLKTSQWMIIN